MKKLKKNLITSDDENSIEYLKDNLTFNGYSDSDRLLRIIYVKCGADESKGFPTLKTTPIVLDKMELPKNLSLVDSIKTVSYVLNQVAKKTGEPKNSLLCSQLLSRCLPQYNFTQIDNKKRKKENCVNLYIVDGAVELFPTTNYYFDYFDWYQNKVSREDLQNTYKQLSLTFPRSTKINYEDDLEPGEE